jgi:hypothetical protein
MGITLSTVQIARADDAAKKAEEAPPKVSLSGTLDLYYMYNMNHPPVGANAAGRAFDVKNDSFSLGLLMVNINKPTTDKSPLGYTAVLTVGKTADIVHATEPGGMNTYKYLQQAYVTYVLPGKAPITVDFGKFVTMMGYEVIGPASNDNYSNSLLFTYAIPFYHTGLRVTYPFTPKLTGQLHIVNGWNDVEDDNGGKSIGVQLAFNPSAKMSFILNWMGGDEGANGGAGGIGFATPGIRNVNTIDLVGIYNLSSKIKLGANVDYASASAKSGSGGNWSGEAVYLKYQFKPTTAGVLRLEHFEDNNGLRTGPAQNVNEITATLEHVWKSNLVTRVEFRHDHAGAAGFFPSGSGGSKDQDTLTFAQIVKF